MTRHSKTFRFIVGLITIVAMLLITLLPGLAQRRLTRPGTWEGEHLVNSGKVSVTGGRVDAQRMSGFGAGWSGDSQLFWGGGQPGAVLDLTIDIGEEGTYEVELHMTRAPDFGRLRIQVENKNVGEMFDGYGPSVTPSGPISLGSFALHHGPAKVSFMIDGKNPRSSNFFAGVDFIRLNKTSIQSSNESNATQSLVGPAIRHPKSTQLSKTLSDDSAAIWQITSFLYTPEPTEAGPSGILAYKEGNGLNVKCTYELAKMGQGTGLVVIYDVLGGGTPKESDYLHWAWVTKSGEFTKYFTLKGGGHHHVGCLSAIKTDPSKLAEVQDFKQIDVYVVTGIVPTETKWPTGPIIETPIENGKLVVKPRNAFSSHCADGGTLWFEWQYTPDISTPYKPLKMMLKPLACAPDGSVKDISGLQPGSYQVRAQERNGKHNFTSDWSDWAHFKIPN